MKKGGVFLKRNKSDIIVAIIKRSKWVYLTVTIFFVLGLSIGALMVKALDFNQKKELVIYLNRFFQIMDKENVKGISILYQSLKNNFQTVFFIWLLSITVIGVPVTMFIISFRGFIIGFTAAFFIEGIGWKGVLLTIVAIVPQNIIYIPCLIAIASISLIFSLNVLKRNLTNGPMNQFKNSILNYTVSVFIIYMIMCIGSILEAYLSPALLKAISNYMSMQ